MLQDVTPATRPPTDSRHLGPGVALDAQLPAVPEGEFLDSETQQVGDVAYSAAGGSGNVPQKYGMLPRHALSPSASGGAGPLGEGTALNEISSGSDEGTGSLPGVLTMQTATASISLALDDHEGVPERSATVHALLPGIDRMISQYRKMLTEVNAAVKQVKAMSAFCVGAMNVHTSMKNEEDPLKRQYADLMFAMIVANNYVEIRNAGVQI